MRKIKPIKIAIAVFAVVLTGVAFVWVVYRAGRLSFDGEPSVLSVHTETPSLERMKREGCVADGFLSDYGNDTKRMLQLVNHSECYYLHRALETWLAPPDFDTAGRIMKQVTKPDVVYGMFLAEAINTRAQYFDYDRNQWFDWKAMCREGTENKWGEGTCVPSMGSEEYRAYLRYVTGRAMGMGIQSFLFGQVSLQDGGNADVLNDVLSDMHREAVAHSVSIVIGGQTNDNTDERYIRLFDYIEGGVGIDSNGNIEDGKCLSKYMGGDHPWCWALLWNLQYAEKAKNVFIHLDWSGKIGDDMDMFAAMNKKERAVTLTKLYRKFTGDGMGFLLPLSATLDSGNGGCYGRSKGFYSANREYGCDDEGTISDIIRAGRNAGGK